MLEETCKPRHYRNTALGFCEEWALMSTKDVSKYSSMGRYDNVAHPTTALELEFAEGKYILNA